MALSLKPQHLSRYKDIAKLFFKYGRGDLLSNSGLDDPSPEVSAELATNGAAPGDVQDDSGDSLSPAGRERARKKADELADDLEKLGPTYVKVGQFLSTRADLLPAEYVEALA